MTTQPTPSNRRQSQRHPRQTTTTIIGAALIVASMAVAACDASEATSGSTEAAATTVDDATTTTIAPDTTTTTEPATTTTTQGQTTTTEELAILGQGSGSGDAIVELSITDEEAAVTFTHDGSDTFTVRELGKGSEPANLLIDTTGTYTGTRPLQWTEPATGFEITADGDWSYLIVPMRNARHEECPFEGEGDDVVLIQQYRNGPSPAHITFDGDTAFTIWIYGFSAPERIVDENGPYDDTIDVADKMFTWDIIANGGAWTIECG